MKKLALSFLLLVLLLCVGLFWLYKSTEAVSDQTYYVNFTIPAGSSATQIGNNLYQAGIIRNPNIFKYYVQISGISSSIQAGDYRLSSGLNLFQIADILAKSPVEIKVSIPEGFTRSETATKFAKSLGQGQTFIDGFMSISEGDEGYLFPDTYLVANNSSPATIITKMKTEFNDKIAKLNPTRDQIILASIIEKETKGVEERPIVAGILLNRLNSGMALQVDIAPETYKVIGLPAAPIANPGLISIEAAVSPVKTDYWYYLHDSTGQIHYAKTLAEQNANIKKYLQ